MWSMALNHRLYVGDKIIRVYETDDFPYGIRVPVENRKPWNNLTMRPGWPMIIDNQAEFRIFEYVYNDPMKEPLYSNYRCTNPEIYTDAYWEKIPKI